MRRPLVAPLARPRGRILAALAAAALSIVAAPAAPAAPRGERRDDAVLLTKPEALRLAFPGCERALEMRRLLAADEKAALERTLGRRLEEKGFLVYLGLRGDELDGFAVITNELGKAEPITMIVAVGRDGRVRRTAVMAYRETHGGEVRSHRFLAQLEGKSLTDPIEIGRDVVHVSGATISSVALCAGTRKSLALLDQLFLHVAAPALVAGSQKAGAKELLLASAAADGTRPATSVTAARDDAPARIEARRLVMGSELAITARSAAPDARAAVERAFAAAEALDAALSDWRDDSELSRLNASAARGPVAVSAELLAFLRESRDAWRASGGAFDPAIGALVRAWGFRGGAPRRPADDELARLVADGGFAHVVVDFERSTVAFELPGVRLDPGAIGKGMAVDAAASELRRAGIVDAFLDFGSTQRALGSDAEGLGWPVAIRDPRGGERPIEVVLLKDAAISTSGGYEKFIELDGEKLPHLLDPRSGRPVRASLSASVIVADGADCGARSDALATALFVLGPQRASGEDEPDLLPAAIASQPGAAALLVPANGATLRSARWPGGAK